MPHDTAICLLLTFFYYGVFYCPEGSWLDGHRWLHWHERRVKHRYLNKNEANTRMAQASCRSYGWICIVLSVPFFQCIVSILVKSPNPLCFRTALSPLYTIVLCCASCFLCVRDSVVVVVVVVVTRVPESRGRSSRFSRGKVRTDTEIVNAATGPK